MKHGRAYFFSPGSTRPCGCSRSHGGWHMSWRRQATHQVGTPSRWLHWSGLERCGSSWDWTPKLTPRRHQEISLAANRHEPEVVLQRVEALSQCFVEMSVQRLPTMSLRSTWCMGWRKQLRRLAQQHFIVTQTDSQTIINAIRTWKELAHYQEDRGLDLGESLDFLLFVQEGTDGPVRAIASLKWLNDVGTIIGT